MSTTWTLFPLINQRLYTQNEKIVLEYFFTNVDKNIYCAKDTLSNQVWAFLVGQYSRSALSLRDRFLQLFDDQKKAFEAGKIPEFDYISLDDLAAEISKWNWFKMDYFNKKSSDFLKKWWVDYGHNSLKDSDRIRFAIEWVSQVFTKVVESPFPALWDFQEKSTRYVPFAKESVIFPPELEKSKYKEEIIRVTQKLLETYDRFLPVVKQVLLDNAIFNPWEFSSSAVLDRTVTAKAFDIVRYLLPASMTTSLWAGLSTRILETHLSYMLSHPLEEVRMIAKSMHQEALKLSPWLLSHVKINEYEQTRSQNIANYIQNHYSKNSPKVLQFKWISDEQRVKIVSSWDLDNQILASIFFEWARTYGVSFDESLMTVESMTLQQKKDLMQVALESRGQFDRMPRALQHSTVMCEFLMDFGAYRDMQRHRASKQLWQGATSIHGYDYPELIDLPWMEEFKSVYDEVMTEMTQLGIKVARENPFLLEYVSALWHLIRTTCEMDPGQIAYVIELRSTPQWHHSYRKLCIKLYELIKEKAPLFAEYIRVWSGETWSRKSQEEKAEAKRKALQ